VSLPPVVLHGRQPKKRFADYLRPQLQAGLRVSATRATEVAPERRSSSTSITSWGTEMFHARSLPAARAIGSGRVTLESNFTASSLAVAFTPLTRLAGRSAVHLFH
jgi:hypothetical protein